MRVNNGNWTRRLFNNGMICGITPRMSPMVNIHANKPIMTGYANADKQVFIKASSRSSMDLARHKAP